MTDSLTFDPHAPDFMQALCQMSLEAGQVIMRHYRNGVATETKSDQSPVTQADRDAEELLEKALAILAPNVQIIGEEACASAVPETLDPVFFLLDPLDGTRDFIAKGKDFTVNIGLVCDEKAVAGVIYAPVHEKLYFSGENAAYRIDIAPDGQLDMSQATRLIVPPFDPAGLRVIASAKHRAKETDELISQLHIKQTMGASSSYKFCLLADGKADLYPRHGRTMEWDTAAGQAILQAAGGVVTTTDHAPLTYGKLDRGLDNPSFIAATATNWHDAEK